MFGYITPDKPNMYIKDYTVYRAFYCGICKCTGKMYGQLMRFATNYDITFISILLHNILDQKVEISNERCVLNPFKKKSIIRANSLMKQIVNLNTLLADFKIYDDINENNRLLKKLLSRTLRSKVNRARRALPEVSERIERAKIEQGEIEKRQDAGIDRIAHPFSSMIRDIFIIMAGDRYTDSIGMLIYQMGRLIYFIDAVDDIDKDIKSGNYNPFVATYYGVISKKDLLLRYREDIDFLLKSAYNEIKRNYETTNFKICEGVVTNILWYGMDKTIKRVLTGGEYVKQF